jgi:hypothetical protein
MEPLLLSEEEHQCSCRGVLSLCSDSWRQSVGKDAGSRRCNFFQKHHRYYTLQKKAKNHCPPTLPKRSISRIVNTITIIIVDHIQILFFTAGGA